MNFITIILIAFGLSMDAFAVSITKGILLKESKIKYALKIGIFFGVFQGVMPFIGWFVGVKFEKYITGLDHWIALILLGIIGGKMAYEAIKGGEEEEKDQGLDNKTLTLLAIATSIDALAVGVSFAFLKVAIVQSVVLIGVITLVVCFMGVLIGKTCGPLLKNNAELVGGIVLMIIGLKIFAEHTEIVATLMGVLQ